MTETPFFFDGGTEQLFGVLHRCESVKGTGFVFCHPFMEEKLWAHRVFVHMARKLATRGYPVLRFDCRGNGDSDGEFSTTTMADYLADIGTAIGELHHQEPNVQHIGLLGLRLGASFSLQAARQHGLDGPLVLWEPITNGDRYSQEILRSNLTAQMAVHGKVQVTREQLVENMQNGDPVDVEGYEFSWSVFDSLRQLNLEGEEPIDYAGRSLILQTVKNEKQPLRKDIIALADRLGAQATVDKVEEEPFWREIKTYYGCAPKLEQRSLDWLEGRE